MKQSLESLKEEMPEVESRIIEEHLSRLDKAYFKRFSQNEIKDHILSISRISSDHPVEVIFKQNRDESIDCTVLSFDYPSVFSLITGILAGSGFNVLSGDVFTYRKIEKDVSKKSPHRKRIAGSSTTGRTDRRMIIDNFSGSLLTAIPYGDWKTEVTGRLELVIGWLEKRDNDSVEKAKNLVNENVVKQLSNTDSGMAPPMFPVEIEIDNETGPYTRLRAISEDTPAFLYALSNALSLNNVTIEHVRIRTIHGRIEDRLDLLDSYGRKIEDTKALANIKFSLLLTKQFTYFLSKAPDPYSALSRFEQMIRDILSRPYKEEWIQYLTDPHSLKDLARLLGTSDFLWEDFIRLQYETLMPLLKTGFKNDMPAILPRDMSRRLEMELAGLDSFDAMKRVVNDFKDHETFLIDLKHILDPEFDFISLSEGLTELAELVIQKAAEIVYKDLIVRYGKPRTIAGLEARHAVLGLGKLGGAALGYASDIELMFVYSDSGETDGEERIHNSEFFNLLARGVFQFIEAKREGIFRVDLRLRPYGDSGPLACSLETFCQYYNKKGQAHSYERLALVRLRFISGDKGFGKQLERIRDELIYFSDNIDLGELQELRERQFREKNISGRINAKFSPGGLVDLEYGVQALQVMHGKDEPRLRTPRIHEALDALSDAGVLTQDEASRLIQGYNFLRNLINGLRMLRGSAKDLFLPLTDAVEFGHLSRRMGYGREGPLDSAQKLNMDLETHMAVVRVFTEKYFGREALPSPDTGTIVDVILSESMPEDLVHKILAKEGFVNPERAIVNIKRLAGKGSRQDVFARLALLVQDILKRMPDPDMALNNWDRFTASMASPEFHYNMLIAQPMQLEMLLSIFSCSQFLADTLIRNPGFFDWLIIPEVLRGVRKRKDIEDDLREVAQSCSSLGEWRNRLRRFRRRAFLRIGTRDIYLGISTRVIMEELTVLAEAFTQVALEKCIEGNWHNVPGIEDIEEPDQKFCIMAFGKMGGNELNYSSDIDLLGVYMDTEGHEKDYKIKNRLKTVYSTVMENVRSDLSNHTEEGYAYRVDLRLRPFGRSGELVQSLSGLINYYKNSASLWEIQAAIKLRPVAGNLNIGHEFLRNINPIIYAPRIREKVIEAVERTRDAAIKSLSNKLVPTIDVKSGTGGIRDIEFMVQGLQLIHGSGNDALWGGNTMLILEALSEAKIIPEDIIHDLKEDYIFLRRTEHFLQILEDRQIHNIPQSETELEALSKRIMGPDVSANQFVEKLNNCLKRTRESYNHYLLGNDKEEDIS